jgi:hypothetical protein
MIPFSPFHSRWMVAFHVVMDQRELSYRGGHHLSRKIFILFLHSDSMVRKDDMTIPAIILKTVVKNKKTG